jgi:hypothetical protein
MATATAVFASGRAEETIFFRWFGGFAAKPTEKDSHFHAAAACPERVEWGEKALMRPASTPTA